MKINHYRPSFQTVRSLLSATFAVLLVLVLAGCANDRVVTLSTARAFVVAPQPPPVMTGPAALLFTNVTGFSAQMDLNATGQKQSGVLFGRKGKLLFIPKDEKPSKHAPAGRFSFLWDVSANQGWLLSDALQGYAPMSLTGMGRATNIVIEALGSADTAKMVALMDTAKEQKFRAVFKRKTQELPSSIEGGEPFWSATFSRISLKAPEAGLFQVPAGFTAYPSAEVLVDELAARYRNLKQRKY